MVEGDTMARKARVISPIGYYSIRLRTDTCEFSETDRLLFLDTIKSFDKECGLLGYLLLPSSFSFVLKMYDSNISTVMRKILGRFIVLYKKANNVEGKEIFKDRFHSNAANTIDDVFSFIGKLHNLGYLGNISISSCSNYLDNKYIDTSLYNERCNDKEEFVRKCNLVNYDFLARDVSDEEIKKYFTTVYKVDAEKIKDMPQNTIVEMLSGVVKFTKASSIQIKRITKLPVTLLTKIKKEILLKRILKNKRDLGNE